MNLSDYKPKFQRIAVLKALELVIEDLKAAEGNDSAIESFTLIFQEALDDLEGEDYFGTEGLIHYAGLD